VAVASLIACAIVQLTITAAWWRLLGSYGSGLSRAERGLAAAVSGIAQVIGVSLLLAWCGWLARAPLIGGVLLLSGGLLAAGRGPRHAPRHVGEPAAIALRAGSWLLVLLLVGALALAFVRDAVAPDVGWDGLNYHLPMVALMRQTGGLAFPPLHNVIIATYPKVGELWVHWLVAFSDDDRWAGVAQMPFLLVALLATYVIARRLGSSRAAAAFAALLTAFAPVVLAQLTVAYTDVDLSAAILAALALGVAWLGSAAPAAALSCGAALGLVLGSKYSGAGFALVLFAALAAAAWRVAVPRRAAWLAAVACVALLLGADSYVRNWHHTDNPFFPYRTSLIGVTLPGPTKPTDVYGFAETRDLSPLERQVRSWTAVDVVHYSTLFGGFGVVGPFLAALSLVSFAVALRARDTRRLALLALAALLFAVTPLSFRLRFVIYLLGVGGVGLAHVLDRAPARARAALVACGLAVAGCSFVQYARATLAPLQGQAIDWSTRADPCRAAVPPHWRGAYAWLRAHVAPGGSVLVFRAPGEFYHAYCLWTPQLDTHVDFAGGTDPGAADPAALRFLPHGSPAFARFAGGDPAQWRILYADDAVTIAQSAHAAGSAAPP